MRHQVASRDRQSPVHQCAHHLPRAFTVNAPNTAWVIIITYIRRWQGWLYLAVVVDLYARRVVGWSMAASLSRELVLDALLIAVQETSPAGGRALGPGQSIRKRRLPAILSGS